MRFGIREICDVVLRAKSYQTLGNRKFYKNEPVLYFDTLKTSTLEGAATTVYAQGGRGNTRLVAWEGERTLTFTMEDALLSMESFSILSGAGLLDATTQEPIYVHQTSQVEVKAPNMIEIPDIACWNNKNNGAMTSTLSNIAVGDYNKKEAADIFVMVLNNGEVTAEPCIPVSLTYAKVSDKQGNPVDGTLLTCYSQNGTLSEGSVVLVDYYVKRTVGAQMIEITADKFGGNYYLEASTLFRRESDGVDMPAEFIIPNCKVQSNFTFSLAASGDPSTFTFTMDAFPDYTKFDPTHKVLAAIQVISDTEDQENDWKRVPCIEKDDPNITDVTVDAPETGVNVIKTGNAIVVTGTSNGSDYNTSLFGTIPVDATEIILTLPTSTSGGTYTVIQNNPVLKYYSGNGVTGTTKTKSYTITGGETLDYSFLVSKEGGPIYIELQDTNSNTLAKYIVVDAGINFT